AASPPHNPQNGLTRLSAMDLDKSTDRYRGDGIMRRVRAIVACTVAILATSASVAADDASLLKQAQELFRPLPQDMGAPATQEMKERIALGRLLFFDPRMAVDGNVSCATCHQPA